MQIDTHTIDATDDAVKESGSYITAIACVGRVLFEFNPILISLGEYDRLMYRLKIVYCEVVENCRSSRPLP